MQDNASNDLEKIFYNHEGLLTHKWHHYLAIYDRHFSTLRERPIRMLEIGVSQGGSLQMWKAYFHPDSTFVGIDTNPNCAQFESEGVAVKIGSQADPAFLEQIEDEFGPFDIILDDGSHIGDHQKTSLNFLWPKLKLGGLYVCEDLHTSYWENYGGGYKNDGGVIEFFKNIIDSIHGWYTREPQFRPDEFTTTVKGIHFYDSVTVLEKEEIRKPFRVKIGKKTI